MPSGETTTTSGPHWLITRPPEAGRSGSDDHPGVAWEQAKRRVLTDRTPRGMGRRQNGAGEWGRTTDLLIANPSSRSNKSEADQSLGLTNLTGGLTTGGWPVIQGRGLLTESVTVNASFE